MLDPPRPAGLRRVSAPDGVWDGPNLIAFVGLRFDRQTYSLEETAWALIRAVVQGPEADIVEEGTLPLKAARYLLGLADEDDFSRDTGLPWVSFRRTVTSNAGAKLSSNKRLRVRAAVTVGRYGGDARSYTRLARTPRGTAAGDRNLRAIAIRLLAGIETLLTDPSSIELGVPVSAVALDQYPKGVTGLAGAEQDGQAEPDASERETIRSATASLAFSLADAVDAAPLNYPPGMTTTMLASVLTLSPARFTGELVNETEGLYAGHRYQDGSSALDLARTSRRLVVLGDPGFGKSTILKAAYIEAARSQPGRALVFATLPEVVSLESGQRIDDPIAACLAVARTFLRPSSAETPIGAMDLATRLATDPDALLCLDAMDEVDGVDERIRLEQLLEGLVSIPGQIVISSRFNGYQAPRGQWLEQEVDALDDQYVTSFLTSWFEAVGDEPAHARARAALESSPEIAELARIPAVLGIIAQVAQDGVVPTTLGTLYGEYLAIFLEGRWRPARHRVGRRRGHQLWKTAIDIAWYMSGRTSDGKWKWTVTAAELYDAFPEVPPQDIDEVLDIQGILTPHGVAPAAASRLHRKFRWLHRTLHEHLVGVRLASIRRDSQPDGERELLDAVQSTLWTQPLLHMFDLLPEKVQGDVVQSIRTARDAGDPGNALQRRLDLLASRAPSRSMIRDGAFVEAIESQEWYDAAKLDPLKMSQHLIRNQEALDSSALHSIFVGLHYAEWEPDALALEALVALGSNRRLDGECIGALARLISRADEDAAVGFIMNGLRDGKFVILHSDISVKNVSTNTIRQVRELASSWTWSSRKGILMVLLILMGVDLDGCPEFPRIEAGLARAIMHQDSYGRSDFSDFLTTDDIDFALRGSMGEQVAYWLALNGAQQKPAERDWSPWARVGSFQLEFQFEFEPEFVAGPGFPYPTRLEESASEDDLDAFASFSLESVRDPQLLLSAYRAALYFAREPSSASPSTLITMWRRASKISQSFSGVVRDSRSSSGPPFIHVDDLVSFCVRRLSDMPAPSVVEALVATDPNEWGDVANFGAFTGKNAEYREWHLLERLVTWADRSNLAFFEMLSVPPDADSFVSSLFERVGPEQLSRANNIGEMASWLEEQGYLFQWRPRLLKLVTDRSR